MGSIPQRIISQIVFRACKLIRQRPSLQVCWSSRLAVHVTFSVSNLTTCPCIVVLHIDVAAFLLKGGGTARMSCMQFVIKLCTEGHTAWDCLLTVACAQVAWEPLQLFAPSCCISMAYPSEIYSAERAFLVKSCVMCRLGKSCW